MTAPSELAADLALAERLAEAAGEVSRRWFRQPVAVERKGDASPVSLADREAEAAIRRLLAAERPGDGIFGEEYGSERLDAERLWVIDPIDGTRPFLMGKPLFGTLIALLVEGRPVVGVVDQPILKERWTGLAGAPSRFNGTELEARPRGALAAARLSCTSPELFAEPADAAAFARVRAAVGDISWGGDCYAYALIASGHVDLVVEAGLKPYDCLALVPIIEGAGGRLTDWQGAALGLRSDGRVVAAGDPQLHREACTLLNRAG